MGQTLWAGFPRSVNGRDLYCVSLSSDFYSLGNTVHIVYMIDYTCMGRQQTAEAGCVLCAFSSDTRDLAASLMDNEEDGIMDSNILFQHNAVYW